MTSIPLITHRMLVAAAAQERRQTEPPLAAEPQWPEEGFASVEVLDPLDWTTPPAPEPATKPPREKLRP